MNPSVIPPILLYSDKNIDIAVNINVTINACFAVFFNFSSSDFTIAYPPTTANAIMLRYPLNHINNAFHLVVHPSFIILFSSDILPNLFYNLYRYFCCTELFLRRVCELDWDIYWFYFNSYTKIAIATAKTAVFEALKEAASI